MVSDAATVLVMRRVEHAANMDALMVRRSQHSPFMPDTWVFPGGRVDDADDADGSRGSARTFEAAARRECKEETGVDLSDTPLRWFDTWQTPSAEPRRYTARFYLATLPADASRQAGRADGRETTELLWISASGMLDRWRRGGADLPPPTLCILQQLVASGVGPLEALCESELATPILPKRIRLAGVPTIVMPHDPGYDSVEGTGSPFVPARVRQLPRRLVRKDNRWCPHS